MLPPPAADAELHRLSHVLASFIAAKAVQLGGPRVKIRRATLKRSCGMSAVEFSRGMQYLTACKMCVLAPVEDELKHIDGNAYVFDYEGKAAVPPGRLRSSDVI